MFRKRRAQSSPVVPVPIVALDLDDVESSKKGNFSGKSKLSLNFILVLRILKKRLNLFFLSAQLICRDSERYTKG